MFKRKLALEYFKKFKERIMAENILKRELMMEFLKDKIISIVGQEEPEICSTGFYLMKNIGVRST